MPFVNAFLKDRAGRDLSATCLFIACSEYGGRLGFRSPRPFMTAAKMNLTNIRLADSRSENSHYRAIKIERKPRSMCQHTLICIMISYFSLRNTFKGFSSVDLIIGSPSTVSSLDLQLVLMGAK